MPNLGNIYSLRATGGVSTKPTCKTPEQLRLEKDVNEWRESLQGNSLKGIEEAMAEIEARKKANGSKEKG